MREAIRHKHPELQQGFDVVLIARGKMADPSVKFETVEASVGILAERAGLIDPVETSAESNERSD